MRVEIWTDIICPWCGLGHHRLESALARFEHRGEVQLVRRSYQLDERAAMDSTETVRSMLKRKKGMADAQIEQVTGRIEQMARDEGLQPYVVLENRVGNTSLAHELAAFATERGRGAEMWDLLYATYFGEAGSIFELEPLLKLAERLELDVDAARAALTSRQYASAVRADGREASELGASGVPFFVIDRRYGVAGAQSPDTLLQALQTAWSERVPTPLGEGAVCGPDGC